MSTISPRMERAPMVFIHRSVSFFSLPTVALSGGVTSGHKNPLWYGLSTRVYGLRQRFGLTQREVADRAGLNNTTVHGVETGTNTPNIETAERFAAALGVPANWLAFGPQAGEVFRQKRPRDLVPTDDPDAIPDGLPYKAQHCLVGARLRTARLRADFSLRLLGAKAAISYQTIAKIEAGASVPQVETVEALAAQLGVSPGWLAFGEGEGPGEVD